ncbi:3'-5' exonuclease [Campylobacter sp. 9BO]|uniref:3'-5' exonuclease n=1 Tax=Campylobacter sp. 9BO TaxID=3424759 RepID=UPI003D331EA5
MAKNYICVFDCESIPDAMLIRKIYGFSGDDEQVGLQAFEMQKEQSGSSFLPIVFHQIVAISAVIADEYGKFIKVSTMEGDSEQEILTKFINFINEFNPRLVSFNGRGFDLPTIMARAMRYNLSAFAYFEVENRELNKSKWDNYRYRNSDRFHLDLLDHISDFGAVRGLKLDLLCASLNLPGKYDVHGDQVFELYHGGDIEKINEYCESDVLNTYWLFLKYELLRGRINKDDYANSLSVMSRFLREKKELMGYTDVFCAAVANELERLEGKREYELEVGNSENFKDNFSDDDDDYLQKIDKSELSSHLTKNGLDGLLKKGADTSLKTKQKGGNLFEEKLPEINLNDE